MNKVTVVKATEIMQDLLRRMQYENDETAFEEFYRSQVFRLFQFAFAFIHNKELSEEIVNDVFLKFWQNRFRIDQIGNLSINLDTIVGKPKAASTLPPYNGGISTMLSK